MNGLSRGSEGCILSPDELLEVIEAVGFLPLFENDIPGFSVENMTDPSYWWCGDQDTDPWEWRIVLTRTGKVAYGKFFGNRAGLFPRNGSRILRTSGATVMISMPRMRTAKRRDARSS